MQYYVLRNGKTAEILKVSAFKAGKAYRVIVEITPKTEIPQVDFSNNGILFKQSGSHYPTTTKIYFPKLTGYSFALSNNATRKSVEFLAYPVRKEREIKTQQGILQNQELS